MFADPPQQLAGTLRTPAERTGQYITESERHIIAGIAIGDREDIDLIQQIPLCDDSACAGYQGSSKHRGADDRGVVFQRNGVHSLLWIFWAGMIPPAVSHF
jgi:hypothetical protein